MAGAKRKSRIAACGAPRRAYKGVKWTPIFRGMALNKSGLAASRAYGLLLILLRRESERANLELHS